MCPLEQVRLIFRWRDTNEVTTSDILNSYNAVDAEDVGGVGVGDDILQDVKVQENWLINNTVPQTPNYFVHIKLAVSLGRKINNIHHCFRKKRCDSTNWKLRQYFTGIHQVESWKRRQYAKGIFKMKVRSGDNMFKGIFNL